MLKSDRSNPSAGISRSATRAMLACTSGPSALGYSNRRKLIPFGCMTASVTPIGVISPSHMKPSNVTSIAVEQLLGDEHPEAPPLEGGVVRGHRVDVGARLGEG